jgi:hypothetical protein
VSGKGVEKSLRRRFEKTLREAVLREKTPLRESA